MERLCDLLFELSNEDRLNILKVLREEPMKISHVAKSLDFTVQETSRNLSRLSDASLISRGADGTFSLTAYGKSALDLLPGYEFLSKHPEYLNTHTLDRIPHEFFTRIGDLANCTYTGDVMITFYEAEKMMDEAEEYLWLASDQHMVSSVPHIRQALERGVKVRTLTPVDLKYPEGYFEQEVVKEYWPVYMSAMNSGQYEDRWLETVDTPMGLSDKQSGRLFFPKIEGDFDYKGFTATDERSHRFIKDLFEYYWDRASTKMPEHLQGLSP
jgi:predicted transcriptional regulator